MNWRDMATAPKDGRPVLVRLAEEAGNDLPHWDARWVNQPRMVTIARFDRGEWRSVDYEDRSWPGEWEIGEYEITPTGWMPLPDPDRGFSED